MTQPVASCDKLGVLPVSRCLPPVEDIEMGWGRVGESRMCTKVLALMGVGAVGGLGGWSGN